MLKNTLSLLVTVAFVFTGCASQKGETVDEAGASGMQSETEMQSGAEGVDQNPQGVIEVIEMANGLTIQVLSEGQGPEIRNGQQAYVHYTGWLYDENAPENKGAKFDSSRDRGELLDFALGTGRVIQGWDSGILGMKVGERRILTIPPDLGYGSRDIGGGLIPPNSTLLFDVELFEIGN